MSSPRSFGAMHKTGCREHDLKTVRFEECGKQIWSEDSSQKKTLITSVWLPPPRGSWLPFLSQLNLGQVLATGCKYSLRTTALQAEGEKENFPQTNLEIASSWSADSHSQLQLDSEAVVSLHFKILQTFIHM